MESKLEEQRAPTAGTYRDQEAETETESLKSCKITLPICVSEPGNRVEAEQLSTSTDMDRSAVQHRDHGVTHLYPAPLNSRCMVISHQTVQSETFIRCPNVRAAFIITV
ncbi:unnamed protein product [Pleuronectes platessa]|uniref:Uncharacterized protein n=1 Tax=Pleuronectes platessa TaxID=8262 RepID=A0A9N7TQD3_PLEPL|nr:unnamed protein product [Pleuronectes platessa]